MIRCFVEPTVYKRIVKGVTHLSCCVTVVLGILLGPNSSQAFHIGERVIAQNTLNGVRVRNNPWVDILEDPPVAPSGTRGTISNGPVINPPYTWYEVKWDRPHNAKELKGWSAEIVGGCSFIGSVKEAEKRDVIVARLFKLIEDDEVIEDDKDVADIVDRTTFHDYNGYGCNVHWERYVGGHAGLDAQTQDKSTDQVFYSLTEGQVTIAGFTDINGDGIKDDNEVDPFNTIGIYNPNTGMTTFYLHASTVEPLISEGDLVNQGDPLGTQGDTGSPGSVHVHLEVQPGESRVPASGTEDLDTETEDPIPSLYKSAKNWKDAEGPNGGGFEEPTPDVNQDGWVNFLDLLLVWKHIGEDTEDFPQYDLNNDGTIDNEDLREVLNNWGVAAPELTADNSSRFGEIPEENALLPNYPNPFNPETWIPYKLSKSAEVTVTIYKADGRGVRTLVLGHQPAGVYQDKSRAAYWDGRNALGEPVASGVYFYMLKAGEFTATRKMLIRK